MSFFRRFFGKSNNNGGSNPAFDFKAGDFIENAIYGIGRVLSKDESEESIRFKVDFDLGRRDISWRKSDLENIQLIRPSESKVEQHLAYRNYEVGDDRYLTRAEMEALKPGDLVLRNRKGFAKILSFGKNDAGRDIMYLEYLESGEKNTFSRYDSGGALVRFSFKHDLSNEFWEKKNPEIKSRLTQDDLSQIEQELNIKLPEFYKSFLLNYPDELVYYNRSRLGRKERFFELELLNDKNALIQNYRYFEVFEQPKYWPIGSDGIGNYYIIKLSGRSKKVYIIDHETDPDDSITVCTDSIEQFIIELLKQEMENAYGILNKWGHLTCNAR